MKLVRRLVLVAADNSFSYDSVFLEGRKNEIADALSRCNIEKFRFLAPQAAEKPTTIPQEVIFS